MQFSTIAFATLSIGSALAQYSSGSVNVHIVTVGNANGSNVYSPNNIVAAAGDMVQFQFMPKNHTVTQSNFDNPCEPIDLHSNVTGIFSGFMPVDASATMIPAYTIMVNDTKPIWIYCSQAKHCQSGMSLVINQNTTANATRSLANYQNMAKGVGQSLAPGSPADGTLSSVVPISTGSSATTTGASSTTSSTAKVSAAAAAGVKAPEAFSFAAMLALGGALFL